MTTSSSFGILPPPASTNSEGAIPQGHVWEGYHPAPASSAGERRAAKEAQRRDIRAAWRRQLHTAGHKIAPNQIEAAARLWCGEGNHVPVTIVDGDQEPESDYRSYYYTTPGGRPVYHPSAYRRAWGKPVYHCASGGITVGADWLVSHPLAVVESEAGRCLAMPLQAVTIHGCEVMPAWFGGCGYLVRRGEREYHSRKEDPRAAVRDAVRGWKTQDRQIQAAEIPLTRVWVGVQDSLDSGNCAPMTSQFARRAAELLGATGEVGAVRADWLLSVRDDAYTRRAVNAAALRMVGAR